MGAGADPRGGVAPPPPGRARTDEGPDPHTGYHRRLMDSIRGALAALVTGLSAALVIVALAILPFLNPVWVSFAQDRSQAQAWTGFTTEQLAAVTNPILVDLVVGPPDFDVDPGRGRRPQRRRASPHARRAGRVLRVLRRRGRRRRGPGARCSSPRAGLRPGRRFWRRLERTGIVIVAVTVVGGVLGLLFFDSAFILFHEIFFPGGNYLFDPGTDRLVQLFPQQFWVESTIGVGVVVIVLALALSWVARRRARALVSPAQPATSSRTGPRRRPRKGRRSPDERWRASDRPSVRDRGPRLVRVGVPARGGDVHRQPAGRGQRARARGAAAVADRCPRRPRLPRHGHRARARARARRTALRRPDHRDHARLHRRPGAACRSRHRVPGTSWRSRSRDRSCRSAWRSASLPVALVVGDERRRGRRASPAACSWWAA